MDKKLQSDKQPQIGGAKAALFVYAMEALDFTTTMSNAVSLVNYFRGYMNFNLPKAANTLTNFMGTAFVLSLLGGVISDTYLTRFMTCLVFGCIQIMGYLALTMQAHFDVLRPAPCLGAAAVRGDQCEAADSRQLAFFYTALYLVALGQSGIKVGLPALGADQFDEGDPKARSIFFNWFLFSLTLGAIVGLTVLVWISTHLGWTWAFSICSVCLFLSVVIISTGKPFFKNNVPKGRSPIVRIIQVFVAAVRNWRLPLPTANDKLHELDSQEAGMETEILKRTDQLRFFDRASIIKTTDRRLSEWEMCTISQVEETKILLRMLPIILSTIFMNTCNAQLQTFSVQQGLTMDPNLFGFKVPAPSIPVIPFIFTLAFVPFYGWVFVPAARRITGIPTGITLLQRIGVGLVLSAISMTVAGVVETHRRNVAFERNMVDSTTPLPMSLFWLSLQYLIFGAADTFTLMGLMEFFYTESSAGMKSLGTAISWCSTGLGYFLSSVLVEVVNKASGGWLASNNLNRDKLNYFYWLLAGLSVVNFVFYLVCASWYKYKEVEVRHDLNNNHELIER
ncbi:protein NRT1/ PTR FAMILY 4.5-like [Aristolochia californica]|uniref:protein NRT1/ PTR FAMILY 4.5-like n=1 Tax=Aristolochia californica TaxID=171875 RepID=UPI0035DFB264